MKPELLQEDIKLIYSKLHKVFPDIKNISIVAGGAIRDWDNNKDIKDIDIFIQRPKIIPSLFSEFSFVKEKTTTSALYNTRGITDVYEVQGPHCPVDLIFVKDYPRLIVKEFDLNFCRIYYDPSKDEVVKTVNYVRDKVDRALSGTHYNPDHVKRLLKKYPDFTIHKSLEKLIEEEDFTIGARLSS